MEGTMTVIHKLNKNKIYNEVKNNKKRAKNRCKNERKTKRNKQIIENLRHNK
jgi:hypothetical protein